MTAEDIVQVYALIVAAWPARLVDPLKEENVPILVTMLPPDMTRDHAAEVVREFSRRGSPFPPSWPEIAQRWQAHAGGVAEDHDLIAGEWLAEVGREISRRGGCAYRPMPEFSDPIIAAAVRQASGSWAAWGATTNGGPGENDAFTRNLVPERDARFRKACIAMLQHRAQTGDELPAITQRRRHDELMGGLRRIAIGQGDEDAP